MILRGIAFASKTYLECGESTATGRRCWQWGRALPKKYANFVYIGLASNFNIDFSIFKGLI